jgi:hypothetical protein
MAERYPEMPKDDMVILAYHSLSHLFVINQHRPLEIEILPSAIQPPEGQLYLQEDGCIGIPKRVLVLAFQAARNIFASRAADDGFDDEVRLPDLVFIISINIDIRPYSKVLLFYCYTIRSISLQQTTGKGDYA